MSNSEIIKCIILIENQIKKLESNPESSYSIVMIPKLKELILKYKNAMK